MHSANKNLFQYLNWAARLLASFFISISASAQEAQPTIHCNFRTIGWENAPDQLYLATNSGYESIDIRQKRFSQDYQYNGTQTLYFYSELPTKERPSPPLTATAKLEPGVASYIILFLPTATSEKTQDLQVLGIPESETEHPTGSLTIVNTTPATLGLQVGEEKLQVAPIIPQTIPLPPRIKTSSTRLRIPMKVYWKSPEGWEILRSTFLFIPAQSKQFIFFHKPVWNDGINEYTKDPIQWTTVRI